MKRKIPLHPDGGIYSIQEIEERLQFQYLERNGFEDRAVVEAKGIEKLKAGGVSPEALDFGSLFAREIQSSHLSPVSVRWINDRVGYGLFAEEKIEEGTFVGEYTGIVRENDRRYFEPLNNYCYEYPVLDSIGRSFVIDATQGNLTRFINHSFAPNLRAVYAFLDGFYHCIFLAARQIEKGAQLSYNYGKSYWYIREAPEEVC